MRILLKDGYIVTMNEKLEVYTKADILIENDKIADIGQIDAKDCDEVVNCDGKILMPALINTHVHTSQQLGRGLGDDVGLLTWLHERTWPYESNLTEEDSYVSTLLCGIEQIRSGCVSFAEAGGQHVSGMAKGITEIGMRAKLAKSVMDCGEGLPDIWNKTTAEELDVQTELLKKYKGAADGRLDFWYGLRTIFNNSDELIIKTKELADKYDTRIHMHVAEIEEEVLFAKETRGATTVTHLDNLGVLDDKFLAVHTVYLTDDEVRIFRDRKVPVSHNPGAAMRVLGFAKVPMMVDEGVCVTIGTDGAPSNNRMDMISEMYLASVIHKANNLRHDVTNVNDMLKMATINGAVAIGDEKICGSLEVGKKADIIVINPEVSGMYPLHDPIANLVYSMHSENVESSMCDGKWLMKNGIILTVNEEEVLTEAQERADAIRARAGIKLPSRMNIVF